MKSLFVFTCLSISMLVQGQQPWEQYDRRVYRIIDSLFNRNTEFKKSLIAITDSCVVSNLISNKDTAKYVINICHYFTSNEHILMRDNIQILPLHTLHVCIFIFSNDDVYYLGLSYENGLGNWVKKSSLVLQNFIH